jgi:hypothetical protein
MILEYDQKKASDLVLNLRSPLDIGVNTIVGIIHELSLQGFGGYAHLITT